MVSPAEAAREASLGRARVRREQVLHDEAVHKAAEEIRLRLQNGDKEAVGDLRIDTDWGVLIALRPAAIGTPKYQRHLNARRVRKMAQAFDPRLYGVVLVTMRSGKPSVIDGQHRINAAIQAGHGDDPLPALVIPTATYREEAELFVRANHRETTVPVSTGEVFNARMEQGDERAELITKIVTESGLILDVHMEKDHMAPDTIRAIATTERILKNGGPEHLKDVLTTLTACYGGARGSFNHWMLMGFHQFLYRYHDLSEREPLVRAIKPMTYEGLVTRAQMQRIAAGGFARQDSGTAIGQVMRASYNDLPGTKKLPEWEDVPQLKSSRLPEGTLYFERPTHAGRRAK